MNKDDEKKPEEEKADVKAPEEEAKPHKDEPKPEEPTKEPKEKKPEAPPKAEPEEKPEKKPEPKPDENGAELDELRAENLRLTTQLEAIKAGFSADLTEEAVLLAEHIAAKEGCDIKAALGKVAEKFPEWKKAPDERKKEKKGGIRVGAPTGDKAPDKKPQPTAVKRWNRFNSI